MHFRLLMILTASIVSLTFPRMRVAAQAVKNEAAAAVKAVNTPTSSASFGNQAAPFLAKYCNGCHGGDKPKADLNLTTFKDESAIVKNRKVWTLVKDTIESGEMPPEEKPQPSEAEASAFMGFITTTFAKVDCASQNDPGRVTIRRLNRAEYNNTIRDLLGVDYRAADDFPSDDVGYGFDNIGDVLTLPPILMEKYLDAAEKIVEQAIVAGPRSSNGPVKLYEAEDLPNSAGGSPYNDFARSLASVSALTVQHTFPRDGEYLLRARVFGQQAGPELVKMAFVVDGKAMKTVEVAAVESDPKVYEYRAKLRGGPRKFGVSFLNDYYNEKDPNPEQRDRNLVVDSLEVQGPIQSGDSPLPESHKKILFKVATKENRDDVVRELLAKFASRAYRRPITPGELARLVKFVDLAQQNGDSFERGMQVAVEAILVSPQFLFRVELDRSPKTGRRNDPKTPAPASLIDDFELASRLSYFLWSSMPDDELLKLALDGKLRAGDNLEKQVKRMLRDSKARSLVENFADQWLQIRNIKTVSPDRGKFPGFDDDLRTAMLTETEMFFGAVVRDDRSVLDLIDSDFTYLNERLAKHYGITGITGEQFRRVSLKGNQRGGLLTQASILTVTSNPTRTSPVKRGKWILEQVLGTPPPPPPGDVPELDNQKTLSGTLRQRMEQHRSNPSCASCHARMDPLGFGFENFDAIGAWREKDGDAAVDSSGVLPSGRKFRGPKELKAILKAKDKDFVRCLSEKLLTYALGRGVEYYDTCAVDVIVAGTVKNKYKFSQLVLEIVKSDPFQKRKGKG